MADSTTLVSTQKDGFVQGGNDTAIELKNAQGTIEVFSDYGFLRERILEGHYSGSTHAKYSNAVSVNDDGTGQSAANWATLADLPISDFRLQSLFKPIAAHAKKGLKIGALIGIGLKAIDTGYSLLMVDGLMFFLWLLIGAGLAALIFKKVGFIPVALIVFFMVAKGFNPFGLIGLWFGTAFAGALYGCLLGAIVGSIVGYFRRNSIPETVELQPEGFKAFLLGILIPAISLGILVTAQVLWLQPLLSKWVVS